MNLKITRKITMINLSNKVYNRINMKQNKFFSYCGGGGKSIFTIKIKEKLKKKTFDNF